MANDPRADLVDRIEAMRERWRRLVTDVGEERMALRVALPQDWRSSLGDTREFGAQSGARPPSLRPGDELFAVEQA